MFRGANSVAARLAITVAIVYAMHFAPNVVRETYLAVALAERATVRVDPYVGLHPDIFVIPGRGAYINNNPGASMIGAVPYAIVRPVMELVYAAKPSLVTPKPPATYDDPRPNRTRFMNEMRARGLDVRLGVAAMVIQLGVNVPLGVLGTLLMFWFLSDRTGRSREAMWFALLYAFGTPMFFRSAFLNQNLILAYCTLFAFLALTWRRGGSVLETPPLDPWRAAAAGALLGVGLLCDYSASPLLAVFGVWVLVTRGVGAAARFSLGAAGPIAVLLGYQQLAFGNALLPAQAYMPDTTLSVVGWHGIRPPMPDLLWRNVFDPAYGLLAFCPMLVASFLAPKRFGRQSVVRRDELWLIFAASIALYLFCSSIAFARLQWNTGIRYLVPAVPLLFIALVPVMKAKPRLSVWLLVVPTVAVSWAVSMTRESVPAAFGRILRHGPELPWNTVLVKTADAYLTWLPRSSMPVLVYAVAGVAIWQIWTRWPSE